MTTMLILFGATAVAEVLTHICSRSRAWRRVFAVITLVGLGVSSGVLLAVSFNLFAVLVSLISLYRMFNMIRIVHERMHERYLRSATRTTSFSLFGVQAVIATCWLAWVTWHTTSFTSWGIITGVESAAALILLLSVIRTLHKTAWPVTETHISDRELPTITVAIPARNETEDLERCLESVIASDYPKLEVIVLDDCSQIKRTPEIIKQFAHDGVRFIQGHEPEATWLPKNQAYARLAEEASGQYILFCGVDIRFDQQSLRMLAATMHSRDKQMLCVLPRRQSSAYGQLSLIQAMRYWWELVPPRRNFNRPPVISSCWIIERAALKRAGGFAAVSRSVMPEAHFAKSLLGKDGYSFLRSTDGLNIISNKQIADQRDTAIRMRYPQLHRRPEQVALLSLAEIFFLLLPFVLTALGFWVHIGALAHILAATSCVLLTVAYELSVLSTRVNSWWFGLVGQPLAVVTDIFLLHYSMSKYEFSTVDWKGRNVCIPVMHVVPHLPDAR